MERHPHDGKPYYCTACGAGFGEMMACEDTDCRLESVADAESRAALSKVLAIALKRQKAKR